MAEVSRDKKLRGALVLTRRLGELIVIDDGRIVLQVVQVRCASGDSPEIRLAIRAPSDVIVDREEVFKARTGRDVRKELE